jgi:hypothetical protein
MLSGMGERVQLLNPVQVTEDVETWLDHLATEMVSTLSKTLQRVG